MPEYSLISAPPLAGTDLKFGTCRVVAPADLAIVSFALPLGGEGPAKTALKSAYGVAVPDVGRSALSRDGSARLARVSSEQGFVIFTHATPDAEKTVSAAIKGRAYTTDQTDVWCGLEVSGPDCRVALERICPIDIHPDAFAVNAVARTTMEHLGTLIIRTDADTFLLLSATSSAGSFLHAVETSFHNVR